VTNGGRCYRDETADRIAVCGRGVAGPLNRERSVRAVPPKKSKSDKAASRTHGRRSVVA
jgi:hypothetical protein